MEARVVTPSPCTPSETDLDEDRESIRKRNTEPHNKKSHVIRSKSPEGNEIAKPYRKSRKGLDSEAS